jgi:hypothetical protein
MLKRLALGLAKGLVIGGALGAALHFGLGWTTAEGVLGYLVAMVAGMSAAVLSGKPPWASEGGWIEGILKGVAGIGLGALAYWLGSSYAAVGIPFELAGVPAGTAWTSLPLLVGPTIAGVFGAAVELDNTPVKAKAGSGSPKVRVADEGAEEEEVEAPRSTKAASRKRA